MKELDQHPFFAVVIDCALRRRKSGSYRLDTIFEIQQLASSAVSNLHYFSHRRRNITYRAVLESLGVDPSEPLKENAVYVSSKILEEKKLLREWLQSEEDLSQFNPRFMLINPKNLYEALDKMDEERTLEQQGAVDELKKFYDALPENDKGAVLKMEATRGEGNVFLASEKMFCVFLEAVKAGLSAIFKNGKLPSAPILLEQARNPICDDGIFKTYRLAIAMNDRREIEYRLIFENRHATLDSHGKLSRSSFFDARDYEISRNDRGNLVYQRVSAITDEHKAVAAAIELNSPELRQSLELLMRKIHEKAIRCNEIEPVSFEESFSGGGFFESPFTVFSLPKETHYPYELYSQIKNFFEGMLRILWKRYDAKGASIDWGSPFEDLLKTADIPSADVLADKTINKVDCHAAKSKLAIFIRSILLALTHAFPQDDFLAIAALNINFSDRDYRKIKKLILHGLYPMEDKEAILSRMPTPLRDVDLKTFMDKGTFEQLPDNFKTFATAILPKSRNPSMDFS